MASSQSDAAPEPDATGSPATSGRRAHWAPGAAAARTSESVAANSRRGTYRDLDQASVMVVELLAGLFVWGGIGWFVGTRFGGHPWLFIAGSLLGFAGGFYMLWLRSEGRVGRLRGAVTRGRGARDDEPAGADGDAEGS